MRKILALLVVAVLFAVSAVPAMAGDASCTSKSKTCGFVLPFQRIADTMTVGKAKPRNQLRPILQKVETFQKASDTIEKTADNTQKAFSGEACTK